MAKLLTINKINYNNCIKMKKETLIFLLFIFFISCSDKEKKQNNQNLSKEEVLQKNSWTNLYHKSKIGNTFISNFEIKPSLDNRNKSIIEDDNKNILLANHKGILSYNGEEWKLMKTPTSLYSFANDEKSKRIYTSGNNEFGYIEKDKTLNYIFHSLKGENIFKDKIKNISVTNEIVAFGGEKNIFFYSKEDEKTTKILADEDSLFYNGFFSHKDKIYISIPNGEKLKNKHKKNIINFNKFKKLKDKKIIFYDNFDDEQTLIGINNQIWLFNGNSLKKFNNKAEKYIKENLLSGGINISKTEFAIATVTGGCIVISKESGEILNTVNYQNGLPDDEIFALGKDKNNGLWIVHGMGVSRVNYNFPIKNLDTYPGIEGEISSIIPFENTVYVGTSKGIFHLEKVKSYKELKKFVKIKKGSSIKSKWKITKEIWGFGKKDNSSASKKRYALQSITHIYKKINDLNAKCKQILKVKDYLLIATNKGLFSIKNKNLYPIIKNKNINCLYFSENNNKLYAGTKEGILQISSKNSFKLEKAIGNISENVTSIFEDENKNLLLGCENKIIKLSLNENEYSLDKTYNFLENFSENAFISKNQNNLFSYLSNNSYIYNSEEDSFIFHKKNLKSNLFFFNDKSIWKKNYEKWFCLTDTSQEKRKISKYLSLFDNIIDCVTDENRNTWVVSDYNKIYKIFLDEEISRNNFDVYLASVTGKKETFLESDNLVFEHNNNSIKFKIAAPFYSKNNATYYQYRVENLNNEWSNWSDNGEVNFAYIPPGDYEFIFKAKNAFGDISEEKFIYFTVSPPYWKTAWFYFFEVLLLASLMAISFLMNRSGKTSKISEMLTFITIITVLQTIAFLIAPIKNKFAGLIGGAPLFSFLMNVILAYVLTPIGEWVKKWLEQSKEEDTLAFKEKLKNKIFYFKNYFK